MNELEVDPAGESGRAELSRCLRRCDELEARLGHALEEQRRIRQGLQSRLLENQEAHRREVQLSGEKWAQEKMDLQSQWQESRDQFHAIHAEYQQTNQALQSRLEDSETTIAALSQQVQDSETTIAALSQQVQDSETTITAQSQQLLERQSDLKFFEDQLHQVQHRLDSTLNELNGVYRSLSWRLTAPLRWLHRPFPRQGAQ
jgi:chromosome segregation ATPase